MNTVAIKQTLAKTGEVLAKNSPKILTGLGVVGVIGTSAEVARATVEARDIFLEESRKVKSYTKKDVLKWVWKCYIPSAISGAVTIACIVGSNHVNLKRTTALASLYSISEASLKEYKSKVIETIGKKKEEEIRDKVHKDQLRKNPVESREIFMTGKGEVLCYDSLSGRYFRSDIEKIRKAQNDMNQRLLNEMYISLNELYFALGLQPIGIGDDIGWNVDNMIDLEFSSQLTNSGEPCLMVVYAVEPRANYK